MASHLLPTVHKAVSLLKRWLVGWLVATHQRAVSHGHLGYCLDEFTFRFNRRTLYSRGKLICRLVQQATQIELVPYKELVKKAERGKTPHHKMSRVLELSK